MDSLVRNSIIKTAEVQFVKFGIRAVSVDDICSELRISKKTFYVEFAQKEDLVREVHARIIQDRRRFQSTMMADPSLNVIDRMFLYRLPAAREKKKKYERFHYELVKYYPEIVEDCRRNTEHEVKEVLTNTIEEGVRTGYFRKELNVDIMARFLCLWHVNAGQFLDLLEESDKEEALEVIIDGFIRMLSSELGMQYYKEKYLKK